MRFFTTILIIITLTNISFSQKSNSNLEKFSQKLLKNTIKSNLWLLDTTKSYTGQGSTGWNFDYIEIVKSRNSKGLPTLIETKEKREGTQSWVNVYHAEISYFYNDTVSEYKLKEWNANTNNWNTELSYYETKNEQGKKLIHFLRTWSNSLGYFTAGNKEIYSYSNGLKIIKEDKDWNNGTWEDFFKTYYYYDNNNNDTLELQKRFISSGNWRDNWKTKYEYDINNKKIFVQEWGYDSYWDEWFDDLRTSFEYYSENSLIKEEFTERYDNSKSGWYDSAKTKYFYLANDLLEYKEELDLQNSGNNLKYEYTYNVENQEKTFFLYDWNGSSWVLFYKVFDIYDENTNQTSFYSQTLDGTWKNTIKEEYTWNQYAVNIKSLTNKEYRIYPNPVSNILNILLNNKEYGNIEIIDLSGKLILKTFKSKSNYKIDVSSFSKGVYFIKIFTKSGSNTFRFVKK